MERERNKQVCEKKTKKRNKQIKVKKGENNNRNKNDRLNTIKAMNKN